MVMDFDQKALALFLTILTRGSAALPSRAIMLHYVFVYRGLDISAYMHVCIYVHTYMYVYVCVCVCVCVRVCVRVYKSVCVRVYMNIYIYIYMYICV